VKKYPGTVRVIVGAAIPSTNKNAAQIMREVEDWIEKTQETLPNKGENSK
jgi:hypothetical protein